MKICPACQTSYQDETLNFCLNDGTTLVNSFADDAPPTIMLDAARTTDQTNWQNFGTSSPWNAPTNQPQNMQAAQPHQMFNPPAAYSAPDQTLPIISLVLGILSFLTLCCYGGIPFGLGALVVGFIGMSNVNKNPSRYTGKGIAIGGMILGGVTFALAVLFILLGIMGSIFN